MMAVDSIRAIRRCGCAVCPSCLTRAARRFSVFRKSQYCARNPPAQVSLAFACWTGLSSPAYDTSLQIVLNNAREGQPELCRPKALGRSDESTLLVPLPLSTFTDGPLAPSRQVLRRYDASHGLPPCLVHCFTGTEEVRAAP